MRGPLEVAALLESTSDTGSTHRREASNTALGTPAPVTQMPSTPSQPHVQSSRDSRSGPNRQKLQCSGGCQSIVAITVPPASSTLLIHSFATGMTRSEPPTARAPRRMTASEVSSDERVCASGTAYERDAPSAYDPSAGRSSKKSFCRHTAIRTSLGPSRVHASAGFPAATRDGAKAQRANAARTKAANGERGVPRIAARGEECRPEEPPNAG